MTLECKTAMVVEDDVMLRTTVTRHLEDVGLDVVEAGSGDEALAKLEDGHPVDLLFTDVLMPGNIDGLHLAQDVLARWPETKVIIASAMDIRRHGYRTRLHSCPSPTGCTTWTTSCGMSAWSDLKLRCVVRVGQLPDGVEAFLDHHVEQVSAHPVLRWRHRPRRGIPNR